MAETIIVPLPVSGDEDMSSAADIKDVAFGNYTTAMGALNNGLVISTDLLNKVGIKKFDQIGTLEAAAADRIQHSPPKSE